MGHISDLKETTVTNDIADREIFDNYKKSKGKHGFDLFSKNLNKFYELTMSLYVGDGPEDDTGPQSREEAYELWVKYLRSKKEAERYFRAVDDFSAYS